MKILMCRPTTFSVTYSINPWMTQDDPVDLLLAKHQWIELKSTIESLGVEVAFLDQHETLPDMVFAANAGIANNNKVILSNFKYPERQPEREKFLTWFNNAGYETHVLPDDMNFEGGGDCFVWRDHLIAGWGFRTDERALTRVADILGLKLISLNLKDERFYHLDTCMLVIDDDTCLYYQPAFDYVEIKKLPFRMIPVSETDACNFACNGVKIKNNIIMNAASQDLKQRLANLNINVIETDTSEFLKSGGSCRCLVLNI